MSPNNKKTQMNDVSNYNTYNDQARVIPGNSNNKGVNNNEESFLTKYKQSRTPLDENNNRSFLQKYYNEAE